MTYRYSYHDRDGNVQPRISGAYRLYLLDQYAIGAMQGLLASCDPDGGYHSPEFVAGKAYDFAEAMIKERGER